MSDMIFDQWVIGGPSNGRMRHAVMRREAGLPNSYTCSSLCGARGGDGVVRGSNRLYDPTAITDPCAECARKWSALFAPQVPGLTKTCASCETDKPFSQFHADARTKDGLTKTCFDCRTSARAAVKEAERVLERAAQDDWRQAEATRLAHIYIEAMQTFQESPLTPTFKCGQDHTLVPVLASRFSSHSGIDYDEATWECACGTRPVHQGRDDASLTTILDAARALKILDDVTIPGSLDMTSTPV